MVRPKKKKHLLSTSTSKPNGCSDENQPGSQNYGNTKSSDFLQFADRQIFCRDSFNGRHAKFVACTGNYHCNRKGCFRPKTHPRIPGWFLQRDVVCLAI